MFRFPRLQRALALVGLASLFAFGPVSEGSAQWVYYGEPYVVSYGWAPYGYTPRFRSGFFPFARRRLFSASGRFGQTRRHRFAPPAHPHVFRFVREPERVRFAPRPATRQVQVIRPPRFVEPRLAQVQSPLHQGFSPNLAGVVRAHLRRLPRQLGLNPNPVRIGQSPPRQKPQQIAAVPLPPRRALAQSMPSSKRTVAARPTSPASEYPAPVSRSSPPLQAEHASPHVAQPAAAGAAEKAEGEMRRNENPAAASHGDFPAREAQATDSQEPQPQFSQRSSTRDQASIDEPLTDEPLEARPLVGSSPAATARPKPVYAVEPTGTVVSVTFRSTATTPEILTFLNNYNLTIADGPSPDGGYRIRLSAIQLPKDLVTQFVKSMRAQKTIVKNVTE